MAAEGAWLNRYEVIYKTEAGLDEFRKKLDLQEKEVQKGSAKGGFTDKFGLFFKPGSLKSAFTGFAQGLLKNGHTQTHVGANGYLTVEENENIPANSFFFPGRVFEVRATHGSMTDIFDDTAPSWKSLGIKLSDHEFQSTFDLLCKTGSITPIYNAESMEAFITALKANKPEDMKKYLLTKPLYLQGHLESVRYMPESYAQLHYHSPIVYDFKAADGKQRVARFRILPADGGPESGRLTGDQQRQIWDLKGPEDAAIDYLQTEFINRITDGPMEYLLQIQIQEVEAGDRTIYNPTVIWPEETYPWLFVGKITLTSVLPENVTNTTFFSFGNLPEVFSFPTAEATADFNIVPTVYKLVHEALYQAIPKEPVLNENKTTDYLIHILTGNQKNAGTDAAVSLSVIGTEGRTIFRKLDVPKKGFTPGARYTYHLVDETVGDFLCAKVHKAKKAKSDWFLDYMIITTPYNNKSYTMPCYRWITDQNPLVTLRSGKGSLEADEEHDYLKLQRSMEIQQRKKIYQWREIKDGDELEGFPGCIAAGSDITVLPQDVQFDDPVALQKSLDKELGNTGKVLNKLKGGVSKAKSVVNAKEGEKLTQEFEFLTDGIVPKGRILSHIVTNWKDDAEFTRQVLNGANPMKLHKVVELPENLPITDDHLQGVLPEGATLEEELQAGNMFLITYPELQAFCQGGEGTTRHTCAPMCLFWRTEEKLQPIAIQLTQTPNQATPIYTPLDNKGTFSDWLVAKMWVRCADTNSHQLASRLFTHLIMEPIAIGMLRCLPSVHPVHKLLAPHLKAVLAINTFLRSIMSKEETSLREFLAIGEQKGNVLNFLKQQYEEFQFTHLDFQECLTVRDTLEDDAIPGYYFREDALNLWGAIKEYVSEIMGVYYPEDEAVENDQELDNFLQDMQQHGFPTKSELIDQFTTKDDLCNFLVCVIFRCTVQHAAENNGQLEQYGFAANAPIAMMKPVPTAKKSAGWSEEEMRGILPQHDLTLSFLGWLTLTTRDDEFETNIGEYSERHFTDDHAVAAIKRFCAKLKEISAEIKARNKALDCPYEALLPENIRNTLYM